MKDLNQEDELNRRPNTGCVYMFFFFVSFVVVVVLFNSIPVLESGSMHYTELLEMLMATNLR